MVEEGYISREITGNIRKIGERVQLPLLVTMELSGVYIPSEVIILFADPLNLPSEWTTFRSVCKLWNSLFKEHLELEKYQQYLGTLWTLIHYLPDEDWDWGNISWNPGTSFSMVKRDKRIVKKIVHRNPNVPFEYLLELNKKKVIPKRRLFYSTNFDLSYLTKPESFRHQDIDCYQFAQRITEDFLHEHLEYTAFLDPEGLACNPNLSLEFFEEDPDLIRRNSIGCNYGLPWSFYEKHLDKISPEAWEDLSKLPCVTWEVIKSHPKLPWDWDSISENPNITWEIVRDNPDRKWNYKILQSRLPIKVLLREKNYFSPLDMDSISENPTIRARDVLDHLDWEWNFAFLSFNLFENYLKKPLNPYYCL